MASLDFYLRTKIKMTKEKISGRSLAILDEVYTEVLKEYNESKQQNESTHNNNTAKKH